MRTLSLHLAAQTGSQRGLVMFAMGTGWVAGTQREGESPGNNELWKDCDPRKGALGLYRFSCCSVAKSCPTLCDPMDCGTAGLPVFHHFPEFAQTHVH